MKKAIASIIFVMIIQLLFTLAFLLFSCGSYEKKVIRIEPTLVLSSVRFDKNKIFFITSNLNTVNGTSNNALCGIDLKSGSASIVFNPKYGKLQKHLFKEHNYLYYFVEMENVIEFYCYDIDTQEVKWYTNIEIAANSISDLVISNSILYILTNNNELHFWDLKAKKLIGSIQINNSHMKQARLVKFMSDILLISSNYISRINSQEILENSPDKKGYF